MNSLFKHLSQMPDTEALGVRVYILVAAAENCCCHLNTTLNVFPSHYICVVYI